MPLMAINVCEAIRMLRDLHGALAETQKKHHEAGTSMTPLEVDTYIVAAGSIFAEVDESLPAIYRR